MPVFTRWFSPEDYGIVAMFSVLVGFFSPIIGMSINGSIGIKYFNKENIDFPLYITNCFYILICSSSLVGVLLVLFSDLISKISLFPKDWLWLVIVVAIGQFISQIILVIWQIQVKPLAYGTYQIMQTACNIGLSLLMVVGLKMNWQGRVEAQVITFSFFGLIGLLVLLKQGLLKKGLNLEYISNALKFGIPLIPHSLAGFAQTWIDRILISNMIGLATVGVYTIGYQIGMIIGLVEDAFNQAWVPWLYERLKLGNFNVKLKIVKITYIYFFGILFITVGLSLVAPWFLSFFVGKKFQSSVNYVFWIALGYAFNGMYKMVCNYIFYVEKTYILAWITFVTSCINIGITFYLIRINGAIGAAQGAMFMFFLKFIITWLVSSKLFKMPWNLRNEN